MSIAEATLNVRATPAAPYESYPGAQSVSRAVALLKSFSDAQPEWALGDLAAHLGLNKTTAHRLLAALESEGLIVRSPLSGGYRLGPAMIVLGGCAMRSNDLRSVSRAELVALADATGETTTLEVLAGAEVVILDEASGRHLVGMAQDVGARLPAHATSTGKLLLAHGDAANLEALRHRSLPRLAARTVASHADLHAELTAIRDQGYAVTEDELEAGFAAVAAPVRDHTGSVVAAISVGGPSVRLRGATLEQAIRLTCAAALRISSNLGFETES